MVATVKKHADILRVLQNCDRNMRKSILKAADKNLIKAICECTHNTLKGTVPLNKYQMNKLRRHKQTLRKIVRTGENWKRKKKYLVQNGGAILPLLLGPLLGAILGNIFN